MPRANVSSVRKDFTRDRWHSAQGDHLAGATRAAFIDHRAQLGVDRVALTKRTALLLPLDLTMEAWRRLGEQIFLISDSSAWWLGDWLNYGEKRYPDRYKNAIEETSLNYQTLRNYAWVARRFSVSRRRDRLSFQHHLTVAALTEPDQDRWLNLAEESRWSVKELRKRLRETAEDSGEDKAVCHTRLELDLDPERSMRWREAASKTECMLADWVVMVLDQAARSILAETGSHAMRG